MPLNKIQILLISTDFILEEVTKSTLQRGATTYVRIGSSIWTHAELNHVKIAKTDIYREEGVKQ